jgi:hypothetical protein
MQIICKCNESHSLSKLKGLPPLKHLGYMTKLFQHCMFQFKCKRSSFVASEFITCRFVEVQGLIIFVNYDTLIIKKKKTG